MKLITIVLLIIVCLFTISATTQKPTFEYKVEAGISEGKLNNLANQGWEVVTAGNYAGGSSLPYVILRRPK